MAVAISGGAIDHSQAADFTRSTSEIDLNSMLMVRAMRARRDRQKWPWPICLRGAGKCVAYRGIVIKRDHRRLASAS
jgi:hypothetical protein